MKNFLKTLLLLVLIAGFTAGGLFCYRQYNSLETDYETRLNAAQSTLADAVKYRDSVDPSTVEGARERDAMEEAILKDAEETAEKLREEISLLEEAINDSKAAADALRQNEDTVYFESVYNSLKEGRDQIEEYMAED